MLIKLPKKIINVSRVNDLIADLQSGKFESATCNAFFEVNPRISNEPQAIEMIIEYLEGVIAKPTELLISFAQAPDEEFITELADWARANIHDNILLKINVDPMQTGGVIVRTPQRIYYFSWNNILNSKRELLTKSVSHGN